MRIVIDTNVLISALFFGGPPSKILQSWGNGKTSLVLSAEILDEYFRVGRLLNQQYPEINIDSILTLIASNSQVIQATPLNPPVCDDPDDDKFLACALAGDCKLIISGDKDLIRISGYRGVEVLTPRQFIEKHLRS